jgi:riboflavin kinase / FMN adenylyltransferase
MTLRVFRSAEEWRRSVAGAPAFFAIGSFDGIHVGHQRIFASMVEEAHAAGQWGVALTFDPHPLKLLHPHSAPPLITTLAQRLDRFQAAGLDAAVFLPFTAEFSALAPEEFAQKALAGGLCASTVYVGENFRFGHRQIGDARRLVELGDRFGFRVRVVKPVYVRGELVSSTLVRHAVAEGRVERAARMLGRPFALTGEIRPGTGQGRKLVVPTLNLSYEQELVPASGVYATEALLTGKPYRAATNVGFRPTFNGTSLTVESHLLDFSGEIAAGRMELRFCKRLRDEMKFPSPDDLRRQVLRDVARASEFFSRLDRRRAAHAKS